MVNRSKKLPGPVKELEKEINKSKVVSSSSSDSSSDSDGPSDGPSKVKTAKPAIRKRVGKTPVKPKVVDNDVPNDVLNEDKIRDDLIRLSEDGELDKSVPYLKKASKKVIMKIHSEIEKKRIEKANEFLTDLLISKFAGALGGIDAIESPDELNKELRKDPLLRADVIRAVSLITPYIPLLGILSGGVTCAKHVVAHKTSKRLEPIDGPTTEYINDEVLTRDDGEEHR